MTVKVMNTIGTVLIVLVMAVVLPLTVPKLFGYQEFSILTGSMQDVYPVGTAVYVKETAPEEIGIGDVITFTMGSGSDLVTTHRVVSVDLTNRQFITKGDSNESEDSYPVSFDRLVGRVAFSIPALGAVSGYLHSVGGMMSCAAVFALAVVLWICADRIKRSGER